MDLIFTNSEVDYVKDYYDFIAKTISNLPKKTKLSLQGLSTFDTNSREFIFINYEHNLVHPGMNYNLPFYGGIPLLNGKPGLYQVRIENPIMFLNCKFYIEYSLPNIENIKSCPQLRQLLNKTIYIPPLLCKYNPISSERDIYDVITSFYIIDNPHRPRRKLVYDKLTKNIPKYLNIPKVFGDNLYEEFYRKSKILVNIHQTDFHHTFEELRVLPALLNGLIVIAENSPLKETIPYTEYIIWTDYDKITEVTKDVLENYKFHYERIHGKDSNLRNIIENMEKSLLNELDQKITD
jgi:hypothetical protein